MGMATKIRKIVIAVVGVVLAALLTACGTAPVVGGMEEVQANRVVLALDRAKVASEKEPDPDVEGRFRVVVSSDDATRALAALRDEDLPQARQTTLLEATASSGAIVPSAAAEHATLLAGLQGEIARTLEAVPGVLAARVHVNAPMRDALTPFAPKPKASASVLVEHTGTTVPIASEAVAQLVSHAIADVDATDVAVVMIQRHPSAGAPAPAQLAHVLSIAVAPGSVRAVHLFLGVIGGIVFGLVALSAYLLRRVQKLEAATVSEEARGG